MDIHSQIEVLDMNEKGVSEKNLVEGQKLTLACGLSEPFL